jgi:hypothetical protein
MGPNDRMSAAAAPNVAPKTAARRTLQMPSRPPALNNDSNGIVSGLPRL